MSGFWALTCPTSSNAITTSAAPNFLTIFAFVTKSSSPSFKLMELTIHFPWEHLRPASTTEKLLESIQRGSYEREREREREKRVHYPFFLTVP